MVSFSPRGLGDLGITRWPFPFHGKPLQSRSPICRVIWEIIKAVALVCARAGGAWGRVICTASLAVQAHQKGWGSLRWLYFKGEILNQAYISKKIRVDRLYPSPPEDQDELVSGLRMGTCWEWK